MLDKNSQASSKNSSLHSVDKSATGNGSATRVLEAKLVDLDLTDHPIPSYDHRTSDSGSYTGDDDDADNISLGSVDTDANPNTLPPTYDLASILGSHAAATGAATAPGLSSHGTLPHTTTDTLNGTLAANRQTAPTNGRIPLNLPSTAEMENMPNDVVAMILETLTILELFDLHTLSDRWRQLTTRALLDKFMQTHIVLWIDQEGHRAFRPIFLFDSFDEATNRIRWTLKPSSKPEKRGQVYSKTFGISKPVVRIISVGEVDKYDYLDKEAQMPIQKQGTRTLLGSDKGCPWAFIFKVTSFTRKGRKINGERWIEPISFECHLDFLNPRRAHKLRLLWYIQKSYAAIPLVGGNSHKQVNRAKVEGAMASSQMSEFFNGSHQPLTGVNSFR
ncbi:hypothetical protein BGW38_000862 [Lunasporangiospora selenospora]|uniref:F-box domain-containing protein n=1 Tax=Lunasporangiospora selenospora TaxID=979761 RepID=A0A9P6FV31_9FUNG|nr:hypothetical protein BGW38_000862 [Lunasporangiospora selenospora]